MSTATLGMAFIPGIQTLGIGASLLFFFCRIAQGLAVGGEYGTAMTYAYEFNARLRTFYGACIISSTHIGGLAGFLLLLFRSLIKEFHVETAKNISEIAIASVIDIMSKTLSIAAESAYK